jgi:sulfoxide reductase catalytic subunit YedY
MLIKKTMDIPYSEITPKSVYLNRRKFLSAMGLAGAAGIAGRKLWDFVEPAAVCAGNKLSTVKGPFSTTEKITSYKDVTHYNNFYEFGTDKEDPAKNSQNFRTSPWSVSVEGEVKKPRKFTMEEILSLAPLEERIYRHRCVEAWSIVVPWIGYPLNTIAKLAEPTSKAQFVAFESYFDAKQMPQAKYTGLQYPYVEGLRLDEALHPLTLITVGMYGETLPNQDGAPVRVTIPWKYGFKSIKSIVKIRFQEKQSPTTWNIINAHEYGFYSNVNPAVDHPRWTQSKERRLGEILRRPTLMFNGYGEQVASLYNGMDLKKNY